MLCSFRSDRECNGDHSFAFSTKQCYRADCPNPTDATFLWECAAKCGMAAHANCSGIKRNSECEASRFMLPLCRCCQRRFLRKLDFEELLRKQHALNEVFSKQAESVDLFRRNWEHKIPVAIVETEARLKTIEDKMQSEQSSAASLLQQCVDQNRTWRKMINDIEVRIDETCKSLSNDLPSHLSKKWEKHHKEFETINDSLLDRVKVQVDAINQNICAFTAKDDDRWSTVCQKIDTLSASVSKPPPSFPQLNSLVEEVKLLIASVEKLGCRDTSPTDLNASPSLADELVELILPTPPDTLSDEPCWRYFTDQHNVIKCRMLASEVTNTSGWRHLLTPRGRVKERVFKSNWNDYDRKKKLKITDSPNFHVTNRHHSRKNNNRQRLPAKFCTQPTRNAGVRNQRQLHPDDWNWNGMYNSGRNNISNNNYNGSRINSNNNRQRNSSTRFRNYNRSSSNNNNNRSRNIYYRGRNNNSSNNDNMSNSNNNNNNNDGTSNNRRNSSNNNNNRNRSNSNNYNSNRTSKRASF